MMLNSTSAKLDDSFFRIFPELNVGGGIKLLDLKLQDDASYFEMMSDPEVTKYMSDEDLPKSVEDARNDVKFWGSLFYRKYGVYWKIAFEDSNELIGTVGLNMLSKYNKRAEISYDLKQKYWRQGIMKRVLSNVLLFAFQRMHLERIEARTMLENEPSRKLLEKMGFKLEGILRKYRLIRAVHEDITLYSLMRDELRIKHD